MYNVVSAEHRLFNCRYHVIVESLFTVDPFICWDFEFGLCFGMQYLISHHTVPLFVGQLSEDKSLALRAHDLIFTTPLNSELLHSNSLLELIYCLSNRHMIYLSYWLGQEVKNKLF